MAIMGLLFLLFLGQSTPSLALSREYHFVDLWKNWADAQSYCREKFADLATIETLEDQERIKEIAGSSGALCVLIGLYDDVYSWRWSLDNTYLYPGGNTDLGSWFDFSITNKVELEHCVFLLQGTLHDANCEDLRKSVCYDEPSNSYIPVDVQKTWSDAQSYCRETHTDLASVRSQQEMDGINSLIDDLEWWIGLSREGWVWSDRSNASLRLWDSTEPAGGWQVVGCTMVTGWHDTFRHEAFPFICSAPIRKVIKMKLKTGGSVDLNDPYVKEALLKQIQQRLRDQGIHQDFKLRWRKQPDGNVFSKNDGPQMLPAT